MEQYPEQQYPGTEEDKSGQLISLLNFIDGTSRYIAMVQSQSYGLLGQHETDMPMIEGEIKLSILTANLMLRSLGGIEHFFTADGRDYDCSFIQWNGFDASTAAHHWTVVGPGFRGVVETGNDFMDELRAKYCAEEPGFDSQDGSAY